MKNSDVAVSAVGLDGLMEKEPGQEDICVLESVGHGGIEIYRPHM